MNHFEYTYEESTLKTLQKIELMILREFHQICEENDIDYFLCGGTAIGYIRHGGFIPWDDDIDVGMTRDDYDKFLKIATEKYSDKYTVMNNETNPKFHLMNTRWGLNGTSFVTDDFKDANEEYGIFLDIFCFDNIPDDEKQMRKQGTWAWFWGKLMILSTVKKPVLYFGGLKAKILNLAFAISYYTFKILHLTPSFFYRKASKHMLKYQNVETKRIAYMFDPSRFTSIVYKEDIYPTKLDVFDEINVRVPKDVDAYLSKRYGDYMQLPPEGKRHNHPPFKLDFGKYANFEQLDKAEDL